MIFPFFTLFSAIYLTALAFPTAPLPAQPVPLGPAKKGRKDTAHWGVPGLAGYRHAAARRGTGIGLLRLGFVSWAVPRDFSSELL